jgi:hypothetical protein
MRFSEIPEHLIKPGIVVLHNGKDYALNRMMVQPNGDLRSVSFNHRTADGLSSVLVAPIECVDFLSTLEVTGCTEDYRKYNRIVCAAIRGEDGAVVSGVRHYSADMCATIGLMRNPDNFYHRNDDDQGFIDRNGSYLTRREAFVVALIAGQIPLDTEGDLLYSEMLY